MSEARLSGRTVVGVGAFLLAGFWAWQAFAGAQTGQASVEQVPVGVVNVERVLNEFEGIKAFNRDFEAEVAVKQAELDKLLENAENIQQSIRDLPPTAIEERRRLAGELFEVRAHAMARKDILQNDIDVSKGQAVRSAYRKMLGAVEQIAARDEFDLVLFDDRAIPLPDGLPQQRINPLIQERKVLYARDQVDITQRVLDWMNNQFRVGDGG